MASYNKFQVFPENLAKGVHNLQSGQHQLMVALLAAANAPLPGNTVLANLTQIAYTNLSTRALVITGSAQTGGLYKLTLADLLLTASGGPVATFRYVVVYNDTPTSPVDPLIAWYDYGDNVTLLEGETFTIDFDATNGFLTIA